MSRNRKKAVPHIKGLIQEQVTVNKLDHSVIKVGTEVTVRGLGGRIEQGHVIQVYGTYFTVHTDFISWNAFTADNIAEGKVTVI